MRLFRQIDILRLTYNLLRPNYAVDNNEKLNKLYRLIICLLNPLESLWNAYVIYRLKWFKLANCNPTYAQMLAVLNDIYGKYGAISINPATDSSMNVYFYSENQSSAPIVYLYDDADSRKLYLYNEGLLALSTVNITIPNSLFINKPDYNDFISSLNFILLYPVRYTITVN